MEDTYIPIKVRITNFGYRASQYRNKRRGDVDFLYEKARDSKRTKNRKEKRALRLEALRLWVKICGIAERMPGSENPHTDIVLPERVYAMQNLSKFKNFKEALEAGKKLYPPIIKNSFNLLKT